MTPLEAAMQVIGASQQAPASVPQQEFSTPIQDPRFQSQWAQAAGGKYGDVHEQAMRIMFGLESGAGASPEVLQRLADIRAGKYDTTGRSLISKLRAAGPLSALLVPGGLAAGAALLGGAGAAGAGGAGISAAEGAGIAEGISSAGAGLGGSASLGGATAGAAGAATAAGEIATPEWLSTLLAETGEAGIGAGALEGGFNAALSNAPWWSSLPTPLQNAAQALTGSASSGGTAAGLAPSTNPLMDLIKALGPSALGMAGASNQADSYERLAQQYMGMGAPYRDRLAQLYADPGAFLQSPEVQKSVQMGTDALARSLSAKGGNPFGSGNALHELQNYASNTLFSRLGQEKDRLAGFGGLSQYSAAAPGASSNQIQSEGDIFHAAGAGIANIFNPPEKPRTLAQELADFKRLTSALP